MSLTTKPPGGDPPARTDTSPAGGARAPAPRAVLADNAAALKLLVEEIVQAVGATLGSGSRSPLPSVPGEDPRQIATALIAWLRAAASASGVAPERLAAAVERAYLRVVEILARLPSGRPVTEAAILSTRDLVLAGLGADRTPDPGGRELPPLPVLVEELKSAVVAELGAAIAPPPRALAGEDPGNLAAATLRWLRASAADAGVPLARLRPAIERAFTRAAQAVGPEDDARDPIARAREVIVAALEREPAPSAADSTPRFRPDLPVPVEPGRRARRDARPPRARPADAADPDDSPPDTRHEPSAPPAPDLKGPMELIRQYVEDFHSKTPANCSVHFVYPACAWLDGEWRGFADADALARAYLAERAALAARGVAGGRILMLRVEPIGTTVAVVHARMTRESKAGAPLEELEVAYTTVHTATGWRIAVLMRP